MNDKIKIGIIGCGFVGGALKAWLEENNKAAEVFVKLAYIMAMQASGQDMSKLNEDTFLAWLEGFEANAMFESIDAIAAVYAGNEQVTADPK